MCLADANLRVEAVRGGHLPLALEHPRADHLLGTASAAARVFYPDAPETNDLVRDEAAAWLEQEQSNWTAAYREATQLGRHRDVVELAEAMHWYSDARWIQDPWDEIFALGVEAARAIGSQADEAKLLNFLGWAQTFCVGDAESGYATHQRALAVAVEIGDR